MNETAHYTLFSLYTLQHVVNQIPHVRQSQRFRKEKNECFLYETNSSESPIYCFSWSAKEVKKIIQDFNERNVMQHSSHEGSQIMSVAIYFGTAT